MNATEGIKFYSSSEEKLNIISHAFGLLLSLLALPLLVRRAAFGGDAWSVVSFTIFGASLIVLYAASTFYHGAKNATSKNRLRIFDHASIYALIAGTYTPFALVTLHGQTGWIIFGLSWGLALTGIILKLFFVGKYNFISTLMYVLMGWLIVFAIKPLLNNLDIKGFLWLLAGGISYTIGAIIYGIKKIKFNHFVFHLLVLIGSFCHFISVFYYVLPAE